jgi:hypothetical protein
MAPIWRLRSAVTESISEIIERYKFLPHILFVFVRYLFVLSQKRPARDVSLYVNSKATIKGKRYVAECACFLCFTAKMQWKFISQTGKVIRQSTLSVGMGGT